MPPRVESPDAHAYFTPNKRRQQGTSNSDDETRISTSAPSRRRSADSSTVGDDWAGVSATRTSRLSRRTTTVTWSDLRTLESSQLDWRNRQLDEKLRVSDALLANKEAQVAETQRHIDHLKAKLETLDGTNEHAERVIRRNTELEGLIARIQEDHEAKFQEMAALIVRLKANVTEEKKASELAAIAKATTQRTASNHEAEVAMLRDRVKELEASQSRDGSSFSTKMAVLEGQLARAELARSQAEANAKREVELLSDNLNHKVEQLKQLTNTNAHAASLLSRNTELEKSMMSQHHDHQGELNKLQQRLNFSETDRERAVFSLAERREKMAVLEAEVSRLRSDKDRLVATVSALESVETELAELKANCASLEISRESIKAKLDLEISQNSEAMSRKDRQLETYKDIQAHVDMIMRRNKELEQSMTEFSRQREDELGAKERQILSLRTDLTTKERSLMGAQREIELLRQQQERLTREPRGPTVAELDEARAAEHAAVGECQRLRASIAEAEAALASFKLGAEDSHQKFLESNRRQLESERHELEVKVRAELTSALRSDEMAARKAEDTFLQKIMELEKSMASKAETQSELLKNSSKQRLEEMQTLQQKYEEMIRSSDAEKSRQMREYSAIKEEEIGNLKREIESSKQAHDSELRQLKITFENRLRDKTSLFDTEMQAIKSRLEAAEASKNVAVDDAKRIVRAESAAQLQKFQLELQERYRAELDKHQDQLESALAQKETEWNDIRSALEERLRSSLTTHQSDIRAVEDLHTKEKQRMAELYKSSLSSLESHSQKNLQNTLDIKNTEIAKLRSTIESMEAAVSPRANDVPELERLRSSLAKSENSRHLLEEALTSERARYAAELHKRDKQAETLSDHTTRLDALVRRNAEIERLLEDKTASIHAIMRSRDDTVAELSENINAQKSAEARRMTAAAATERRLRSDLDAAQHRGSVGAPTCVHQCESAKIERLNLKSAVVRLEEQLQREKDAESTRLGDRSRQMELIAATNTQAEKLLTRNELLEAQLESLRKQRDVASRKEGDIEALRAERDAQAQRVQVILARFADEEGALEAERSKVRELQAKLSDVFDCAAARHALEAELESRVAEYGASKERLESERRLLQAQLDTERERLTTMVEQRETQLAAVRESNARAETTLRRNEQLELITDELHARLLEMQKMAEESTKASQRRWAEDTASWQEERDRLAKKITEELTTRYEEDIETTYRAEIDTVHERNANLRKRVMELDELVLRLQVELENSSVNNPNLVDAIDRLMQLERLVAQMQDERDRTIEKVQSQMQAVLRQKCDLDSELGQIRSSVAEKERSILALSERLETLVREKSEVEKNLDDMNVQLNRTLERTTLGTEEVELVQSLKLMEDRNETLEGLVHSLRRTISEQQITLSSLVERAVEAQSQTGELSKMANELGEIQTQCHPDASLVESVILKTKQVQRLSRVANVPTSMTLKLASLEAQCASKESSLEMARQQHATLTAEADSLRHRLHGQIEVSGTEAWRREMSRLGEEEIKSLKSRLSQLGEHLSAARASSATDSASLLTPRLMTTNVAGSVVETTPDHIIVTITPNKDNVTSGSQKRRTADSSSSPSHTRIPSLAEHVAAKRHKGNEANR